VVLSKESEVFWYSVCAREKGSTTADTGETTAAFKDILMDISLNRSVQSKAIRYVRTCPHGSSWSMNLFDKVQTAQSGCLMPLESLLGGDHTLVLYGEVDEGGSV
jgi:hypothetical protein